MGGKGSWHGGPQQRTAGNLFNPGISNTVNKEGSWVSVGHCNSRKKGLHY